MRSCAARLSSPREDSADALAIEVTSALLYERTEEAWNLAIGFLQTRPDLAKTVLARYAHAEPRPYRKGKDDSRTEYTRGQVGELVSLLLEHFPPEKDPRHFGAYWVQEDDSAVTLRDQLISWLAEQKDGGALEALRILERRFGKKYPWLRRPRSTVERAFRQSQWNPIDPTTVALLLVDNTKKLIRSENDAMEGILAAIERYEHDLHHASPSKLEDLWNTPNNAPPTPKIEERISDKLCEAIRDYFREFAVTAEREVQVFRRNVPKKLGGEPGSEVDVLVRIPAKGTTGLDGIAIPIEVKRSNNTEARTGLRDQLVDRYMLELGTSVGVFVVIWLVAPGMPTNFKPVWPSISEARDSLTKETDALLCETSGIVRVKAVLVDASFT